MTANLFDPQLPVELKQRVRSQVSGSSHIIDMDDCNQSLQPSGNRVIRVPMPTFPPTAIVYSIGRTSSNGQKTSQSATEVETVPSGVMARVLAKASTSRPRPGRVVVCGRCCAELRRADKGTQTEDGWSQHESSHHSIVGRSTSSSHSDVPPSTAQPGIHHPRHNSSDSSLRHSSEN